MKTKLNLNTISGIIDPSMFQSLDYEVIKNNLEYTTAPYKRYGSEKIVFEVTGELDDLQTFNDKWAELEKIENYKPCQIEYTFLERCLFVIGNFLHFGFLPIAKITNNSKTEFYTLYNNGVVTIKSKDSNVTDAVLFNMCSEETIQEFNIAIRKIKGVKNEKRI